MKNRRAVRLLNPERDKYARTGGEKGRPTPVTTACPWAGMYMCVKKRKKKYIYIYNSYIYAYIPSLFNEQPLLCDWYQLGCPVNGLIVDIPVLVSGGPWCVIRVQDESSRQPYVKRRETALFTPCQKQRCLDFPLRARKPLPTPVLVLSDISPQRIPSRKSVSFPWLTTPYS